MLERNIEQYLKKQIQHRGGMCYKFLSTYHKGMPDRLVVLPNGKHIWVELKADQGRLSPIQHYRHRQLRELNCLVRVVVGMTGAVNFLLEVDREYL